MTQPSTLLTQYSLLGRSGLRVSPLCLGTMTFGTEWGWGSPKETVDALLTRYLERGGNFLDTADGYTQGTSESMIGDYFHQRGGRDRAVIATKFTFSAVPGDANAGGNGRKNIYRALDGSLKRLKTDYVDLYWLHAWDGMTPVEEVMSTLSDLVRAGKVRYIGFSDTPAWYLSKAQTLASLKAFEPLCALQLEYSLVERNIEREHIPAALEFGLGVTPWSPAGLGHAVWQIHAARCQSARRRATQAHAGKSESSVPQAFHRAKLGHCRCAAAGGKRAKQAASTGCTQLDYQTPGHCFHHHRRDQARTTRQ
jgi:aryl-alcohol dehydrogenase-like predicted oxidoreductase